MKKLIACLFALLFSVPAMSADNCNLFDNTGFPKTEEFSNNGLNWGTYMGLPTIKLEKDVTYTLSYDIQTNVSTAYSIGIGCGTGNYMKDVKQVREITTTNGRVSVTFKPTAGDLQYGDIFAFRPIWGVSGSGTATISNVQLEKGDTPTEYIPYDASCGVGCNLFNKDDSHMILNGYIDATLVRIGTQYDGYRSAIIKVNPNTTYTIQRYIGEPSNIHNRMRIGDTTSFPQVEGPVQNVDFYDNSTTRTATHKTSANAQYMIVYGMNNSASSTDRAKFFNALKIEEGSTATDYVAYSAGCRPNCRAYASATGTVSQSPDPTATNPVEPVFYQQGNIVLRKVGDYKDTYDATTGIITRRVGVVVFNGTENWTEQLASYQRVALNGFGTTYQSKIPESNEVTVGLVSNYFKDSLAKDSLGSSFSGKMSLAMSGNFFIGVDSMGINSLEEWKTWLSSHPVTVYYPLKEPTTEYVGMEWCEGIKIATTKYNTNAFSGVVTALNNAVDTIKTVVANTINQATAVANLQSGKQTMPDSTATNGTCPNYKQCLLVEDESGTPHWYVITDPFRDFVTPILANSTSPNSTTNNSGYTQLEYLENNGSGTANYVQVEGLVNDDGSNKIVVYESTYAFGNVTTRQIFGYGGSLANHYFGVQSAHPEIGNSENGINTNVTLSTNTKYTFKVKFGDNTTTNTELWVYDTNGNLLPNGHSFNHEYRRNEASAYYIFRSNYSGMSGASGAKFYGAKVWFNDVLKGVIIPVRRNYDGVYGVYNTVDNTFTAGTGTFTPGPEVINQDPAIPGMTWTATWNANANSGIAAGTVNGVARCTSVLGTNGNSTANPTRYSDLTAAQQTAFYTPFTESTLANYTGCWCKVNNVVSGNETLVADKTEWVYYGRPGGNTATDCMTNCTSGCSQKMNPGSYGGFVNALFGQ